MKKVFVKTLKKLIKYMRKKILNFYLKLIKKKENQSREKNTNYY